MRNVLKKAWVLPVALLLMVALYYVPPVHSRLAWRLDDLRSRIKNSINPPNETVFQPSQGGDLTVETAVATARAEILLTLTPRATRTPAATSTPRPGPSSTPTSTPLPLPASVNLPGVKYVDQRNRWNYCGPANLTMALNFWGWTGNRDDVAKVIKPGEADPSKNFIDRGRIDKNVMPYELVDFVNENTDYNALSRVGGDLDLIKRFLAAGLPLIVEKGYYERDANGVVSWMGHYQFVTGYDDAAGNFTVQDTYLDGPNFKIKYDDFKAGWRDFDYLFLIVYPDDREGQVHDLLGNWSDDEWATRHALDQANAEAAALTGIDSYFAWFNVGTSHVLLQEYADAAAAYDQAFSMYGSLDKAKRPYRMLWYQTGPYKAYYYSGRYADVIDLATITLDSVSGGPDLEESLYWRGKAYYMSGQTDLAVNDFRRTLYIHPGWPAGLQALQDLGVQP